jgi:putative phage-type endonuclease
MNSLGDRKIYIGGSDIPVIMGENPFKTIDILLQEKAGLIEPFKGNKYTQYGNEMEGKLLNILSFETGFIVKDTQKEYINNDFKMPIKGHIDGKIDNDRNCFLVEVKTAGISKKSDWGNGLPSYYKGQVQCYLWLANLSFAKIIVGFRNDNFEMVEHKIIEEKRDDEYIEKMKVKIAEFIESLENKDYGLKEISIDISEIDIAELEVLKQEKKELENKIKVIENSIKEKMQDNSIGKVGDYEITYKTFTTKRLDNDKLKKDCLYDDYLKESESKRLTIKIRDEK